MSRGVDDRGRGVSSTVRLGDELCHTLGWLLDLYRLSHRCATESECDEKVLRPILERIVDGFEADSGTLALREGDLLRIVVGIDLPAEAVGQRIRLGDGIMGQVALGGKPLLLTGDLSASVEGLRPARPRRRPPPRSALCWPLRSEDGVIGVLSLNRHHAARPFDEQDLERGQPLVEVISLVIENARLHREQRRHIEELKALNLRIEEAREQLLQSEKLAAIGQLAAGVAHEINNPVGYVGSNIGTLKRYVEDLFGLLEAYWSAEAALPEPERARMEEARRRADLDFLREDVASLLAECEEGLGRVKKIVSDLRDFSRVDRAEWQWADVHQGLDSTLNIVWNELKYKAEVRKEYGELPEIECMPSQLNQVFMNLLVNAAQAIEERGVITIRTGTDGKAWVWVEVEDTGKGIPPEHLRRIFEPFFTTKPVGKGTGLGLSLSYGIVERHGGRIDVRSEVGKGTVFRVWLPVTREDAGGGIEAAAAEGGAER